MCAAFTGGDADAGDIAQGIAEGGGVLLRHDLLADDVHGLRRVEDGFGVFRDGGRQGGGRGGDVDFFRDAVEFQHYGVGAGETEVDAGVLEHLFQRLLRRKEPGYSWSGKLADAVVGHAEFEIGGFAEDVGSLLNGAGRDIEALRR